MSFGLAFKAFFRILGDADLADRVRSLLEPSGTAALAEPDATPARNEALTLLAALQREARFVDFVMEPLEGYSDAQVGAAARDVHRDSAEVIRRFFAPEPLRGEDEGSQVEVPAGYDPATARLLGEVSGDPPHRGALQHPGWRATRTEVPTWNGSADAADVIAPAEVEVSG